MQCKIPSRELRVQSKGYEFLEEIRLWWRFRWRYSLVMCFYKNPGVGSHWNFTRSLRSILVCWLRWYHVRNYTGYYYYNCLGVKVTWLRFLLERWCPSAGSRHSHDQGTSAHSEAASHRTGHSSIQDWWIHIFPRLQIHQEWMWIWF